MKQVGLNYLLRFLLELVIIGTYSYWGYVQHNGSVLYALALPIIAMVVWGVFAVPKDPSRSGNAPIPTKGMIRLFIEFLLFVLAACALLDLGYHSLGYVFMAVSILHYAIDHQRVRWLIQQGRSLK